jgi:hypothetical protein
VTERSVRCPICSQQILPGDSTADRHGDLAHLACLEPRKPGAKATPARFKNVRNEGGDPICPVCGRMVGKTESLGRAGDYLVHVECLAQARDMQGS